MSFVDLFVKVSNAPLRCSFAPEQWRKSSTAMIEKGPGSPRVEHPHVIHLFEASCNFCLKPLWGCQMAHQGKGAKVLGNQQCGSRPGHQAIDAAHKKALACNLTQALQASLAVFDNGALGRFNQIIIALAAFAALHLGAPRSAAKMQAVALALSNGALCQVRWRMARLKPRAGHPSCATCSELVKAVEAPLSLVVDCDCPAANFDEDGSCGGNGFC